MKHLLRYFLFLTLFAMTSESMMAQTQTFKELHKVKRKETIFGIARDNGLTIQELIQANPEMNTPGYELRKGDYIKIPFPKSQQSQQPKTDLQVIPMPTKPEPVRTDMRQRELRVGVMLPLHTDNGDGTRMLEYYRGVLMACDSLKATGISTDVCAWNVSENSDISTVLKDEHAADRDVIIGPLYSKQVKALSDFVREHDIRLLIPFSINADDAVAYPNIFRVFQNGYQLNESFATHMLERYANHQVVIIDCNDTTSTKGGFTTTLRRKIESGGRKYTITNLKTSESAFQNSFSKTQPNVVVLNTSSLSSLNVAFAKLNSMTMRNANVQVTVFGYPEWLMYTRNHLDNFYKYDVCIPSTYYMSPVSKRTERIKLKYRWNFHQDMQNRYHARYGVTGFDQAFYFLKGLHMYGKNFTGAAGTVGYTPFQTPLHFDVTQAGGRQNRAMVFVHYTPEQKTEVINY